MSFKIGCAFTFGSGFRSRRLAPMQAGTPHQVPAPRGRAEGSSLAARFRAVGTRIRTSAPATRPLQASGHRSLLAKLRPAASPASAQAPQSCDYFAMDDAWQAGRTPHGDRGIPGQVAPEAEELRRIDAELSALGHCGYSLERLRQVLDRHARRTGGSVPALAAQLQEALAPGRDAAEWNALVGIDGELDHAIKALRTQRLTAFMESQARVRLELATEAEGRRDAQRDVDTASAMATRLVADEFTAIGARLRLAGKLAQQGATQPLPTAGDTLTPSLANALRAQHADLGRDIALALGWQRRLEVSPAAARMLQDIGTAMGSREAALAGEIQALRDAHARLVAQRKSLDSEHLPSPYGVVFHVQELQELQAKEAQVTRVAAADLARLHARAARLAGHGGIAPQPAGPVIHAADGETTPSADDIVRIQMSVHLALPALDMPGPGMDQLVNDLFLIDRRLVATRQAGYSLDALVEVLCDHGLVRQLARDGAQQDAMDHLALFVGELRASLGEDRDALEWNALIGMNAELDGAIRALRLQGLTDFMVAQARSGMGLAAGDPTPQRMREEAAQVAADFQKAESSLVDARLLLHGALERAGLGHLLGGGMLGAIPGLHLDEARWCLRMLGARSSEFNLLIARLSECERAVAGCEGANRLQSGLRQAAAAPGRTPAQARYLQSRSDALHAGAAAARPPAERLVADLFSTAELRGMGLLTQDQDIASGVDPDDAQAWLRTIAHLATQGVCSAAEVAAALDVINGSIEAVLADDGMARLGGNAAALVAANKEQDKARSLGDVLVQELAQDEGMTLARLAAAGTAGNAAAPPNEAMKRGIAALLRQRSWDRDGVLRAAVRAAVLMQVGIQPLALFRPRRHADAIRATLAAWGIAGDADAHMGALIDAQLGPTLDMDTLIGWQAESALAVRRNATHLAWRMLRELSDDDLALADVRDAVRRQALPARMKKGLALTLERRPHERQAIVRDAVRAASLLLFGQAARGGPRHLGAVRETLAGWGLAVDEPTVAALLAEGTDAVTLAKWESQTRFVKDARSNVVAAIDGLKPATTVRMNVGRRTDWQTGSLPVEPSFTVGLNAKASRATLQGHTIRSGLDGFDLVFHKGEERRVGAVVSVDLFKTRASGVEVDALATIDGVRQRVTGVSLSNPNTEAGRAAMKAMEERLLQGVPVTAKDLAGTASILLVTESRRAVSAGAGAKAIFAPGQALDTRGSDNLFLFGGVSASVQGSVQKSASTSSSIRGKVVRSDVEARAGIAVAASLGVEAGTPAPGDANGEHAFITPLAEASATVETSMRRKRKNVFGSDGRLQKAGTEVQEQAYVSGRIALAFAHKFGGPGYREEIARLKASPRPEERERAEAIEAMIRGAGTNEMVSIVMQPRVLDEVNSLYSQARSARRARMGMLTPREARALAETLEARADALMTRDDSWTVLRVDVVRTDEGSDTRQTSNLLVRQTSTFEQLSAESTRKQIRFEPLAPAAAAPTGSAR